MTNLVMLVKDRHRLTRQALESLYEHTPQDQFNLTIVDDGSTDFRLHKVYDWIVERMPNLFMVNAVNSGHVLAKAKNIGVYCSEQRFGRGDWLYISDNDVFFKPNWLRELISLADRTEAGDYALWGGQVHPFHKPLNTVNPNGSSYGYTEHAILDGPSWLMRWQTWDICGPLEGNAPGPCQSEEYPFCEKVLARGGGSQELDYPPSLTYKSGRIGVIHPHVVLHTGLTQADGKDAPGRKEREAQMEAGVIYE